MAPRQSARGGLRAGRRRPRAAGRRHRPLQHPHRPGREAAMNASHARIHPAWLRIGHWLNAAAVLVLATSGWRIYNATGFMGFAIPAGATLGGWLGGALAWHFA